MCRDATNSFASLIGASGAMLDNPIQRFARDINTAANHLIFERESRYGDHARQQSVELTVETRLAPAVV